MAYTSFNKFIQSESSLGTSEYSERRTEGTFQAARLLEWCRYRCGDNGEPAMLIPPPSVWRKKEIGR